MTRTELNYKSHRVTVNEGKELLFLMTGWG